LLSNTNSDSTCSRCPYTNCRGTCGRGNTATSTAAKLELVVTEEADRLGTKSILARETTALTFVHVRWLTTLSPGSTEDAPGDHPRPRWRPSSVEGGGQAATTSSTAGGHGRSGKAQRSWAARPPPIARPGGIAARACVATRGGGRGSRAWSRSAARRSDDRLLRSSGLLQDGAQAGPFAPRQAATSPYPGGQPQDVCSLRLRESLDVEQDDEPKLDRKNGDRRGDFRGRRGSATARARRRASVPVRSYRVRHRGSRERSCDVAPDR